MALSDTSRCPFGSKATALSALDAIWLGQHLGSVLQLLWCEAAGYVVKHNEHSAIPVFCHYKDIQNGA
jgi:hypothetical protein